MPRKDAEIVLAAKEVTGPAFDEVQRNLRQTREKYETFGRTAQTHSRRIAESNRMVASSFKGWAIQLAGVVAGYMSLRTAIGVINEFQQANFAMKATFEENAEFMMAKAKELSEGTVFHANEIMRGFSRTADAMERYGIRGDKYIKLVGRAMDVAAAKGIELEGAITRIADAMRGEAEASEYLGVTLGAAYMKEVAFGGALKDRWETMRQNEKTGHTFLEMLRQTEKYEGKAEEATEILTGAYKNFGNALKDYVQPELRTTTDLLTGLLNKSAEYLRDRAKIGGLFSGGYLGFGKGLVDLGEEYWPTYGPKSPRFPITQAQAAGREKLSSNLGDVKPLDVSALERRIAEDDFKYEMWLLDQRTEAYEDYYTVKPELARRYELKAIRDQEKLNEQWRQQQERLNEKLIADQVHFYERMHDHTADWTYDLLDTQIRSWSDAWDRIKDLVKHAIAEMVAYAITKPIVVPVVTSIAGAFGLGGLLGGAGGAGGTALSAAGAAGWLSKIPGASALGGALGSSFFGMTKAVPAGFMGPPAPVTWGSVLGAAGLGYMGADLLFGGKGYSGLGGAIGAGGGYALGSTIGWLGGPLGAIGGGLLGGALGSLFGGGDKPHKFRAEIGWKDDDAYTMGWGRGESKYAGILDQINEQIQATYGPQIAALEELTDALGVKIPEFAYTTLVRSRDPEQAAKRVMSELEAAYGKYITDVAHHLGYTAADEMFASFTQALTLSTQIGGAALEQAFTRGGGFQAFKDTMRLGVYESVKDGMIQAFIESSTYERIMAPTMLAIENAFARASTGGDLNAAKFGRLLTPILGDFTSDLEKLAPLFNAYSKVLGQTSLYLTGGAIPQYERGIDYVPRTGPAIVHEGERITPAAENRRGERIVYFVNQGVITTDDVDGWLSERQESLRLRRVGRTPALIDLETVGLNIS